VIASDWISGSNMFTSGYSPTQTYAGNLAAQAEQSVLSFGILRSRVWIPEFMVKEVSPNSCGQFVALRQPDLRPVRLVDVIGRARAAHLGRDPSRF